MCVYFYSAYVICLQLSACITMHLAKRRIAETMITRSYNYRELIKIHKPLAKYPRIY